MLQLTILPQDVLKTATYLALFLLVSIRIKLLTIAQHVSLHQHMLVCSNCAMPVVASHLL